MSMSTEHSSKFVALQRQWWRVHMSEKFSSGTINSAKTNKQTIKLKLLEMYFAKQSKTLLIEIRSNLDLLLYGSPDHGLNTNTQIFEAVHAYLAATKRFI